MKFVRITDPQASAVLAELGDELVTAEKEEQAMAAEVAEVDRLLAEVDQELAAQERVESARMARESAELVRRARRRAEREVLRTLPQRLDPSIAEEAA